MKTLEEYRNAKGYTEEFVARKLGVTSEALHKIEEMPKGELNPMYLYILSKLYGFDVDEFLSDCISKSDNEIKRGDIYYIRIKHGGHVQSGNRPCVIVQNNVGNANSPTIIVVPLTTKNKKDTLPTHFVIRGGDCGLNRDSVVIGEQIITSDKTRLCKKIGSLSGEYIEKLNHVLMISLGIKAGAWNGN